SVHVRALTSSANCGVYDNHATFTSDNDGSGSADASESCQTADLHETKTAEHSAPVNAGEFVGFTVTLHNNGPGTATGASLPDTLPGGTVGTVTWAESPDTPDCSISGSPGSHVLSCALSLHDALPIFSVHVRALTSSANCGVYDNHATFTSDNDGSG